MNQNHEFNVIKNSDHFIDILEPAGKQWGGAEPKGFAEVLAKYLKEYSELGANVLGFSISDKESKKVIAACFVKSGQGFYKSPDRSSAISSTPDVSTIGVQNVTILYVTLVVVLEEYRGNGLGQLLVQKAIEYTENELVDENIKASDSTKNDSFKNMVTTNGVVDRSLANYYLSKKYFWILYSAVDKFYERFGFKSYPLDFYKIPFSILDQGREKLVQDILNGNQSNPATHGKKIKLLKYRNKDDVVIIRQILQAKELSIVTDLNKQIFNSELSSGRRSSSSLANVQSALSMAKFGSYNSLASIPALSSLGNTGVTPSARKPSEPDVDHKPSIEHLTVPKISVKPKFEHVKQNWDISYQVFTAAKTPKNPQEADTVGAIYTNELLQKSYYILWLDLLKTYVIDMGEFKLDFFNGASTQPRTRRRSSLPGLESLPSNNFQDLDILLSTMISNCKSKRTSGEGSLYASTNDLPEEIPAPILHDYFLNYVPNAFGITEKQDTDSVPKEEKIELVNSFSPGIRNLPMLKPFGDKSIDYNIDWIASGMWSWG